MKFIRDNFAYIFLFLIAGILIFITVSLQSIIFTQVGTPPAATGDSTERSFVYTLRQQLADLILPATDTPTTQSPTANIGESQAVLPTNTPAVVVLQSPAALPAVPALLTTTVVVSATATPTWLPVMSAGATQLLNAENLTVSEDDNILANIIADDVNTVGFFGYAYYLANQDRLRAVAIRLPDGQVVEPSTAALVDGRYPLARPLLLYTAPAILRAKPQVEAFIGCYLNQLETVIGNVGYALPSTDLFAQALQSFNAGCQRCRRVASSSHLLATNLPACTLEGIPSAPIQIAGSSTLAPLTQKVAANFTALGFQAPIQIDSTGTGAGFRRFCGDGLADIVDASRPITAEERASCVAAGRPVLAFPVAVDALTVVVSRNNNFLNAVTLAELGQIFTVARRWSELNSGWPDTPIMRAIPGAQSGTLDFFVETVFADPGQTDQQVPLALAPPTPTVSTAALPTALPPTPVATPIPATQVAALPVPPTPTVAVVATIAANTADPATVDFRLAYLENNPACRTATALIQLIMERNFGLRVATVGFADEDSLFTALAAKDASTRMDLTFCYLDPAHRAYLQRYFGFVIFIGSGYYQSADNGKLIVMSNAAVKSPIERGNPCFYRFLVNLDLNDVALNDVALTDVEPNGWYEQNRTRIETLTVCE